MVELRAHHVAWADEFRRESARIQQALAGQVDALEHIGSTSVPGLVAKPVIDIAVRTTALADPLDLCADLAELGYQRHSSGPKNHGVYVRTISGHRTHILHAFSADQWEHCNQRVFRDKLLHDPSARHRYQALKESIAAIANGRAYTAAKRSVIEELVNEERADRGLPPVSAWDK